MCFNRLYSYRCANTSIMAFLCFLLCANSFFLSSCGIETYEDIDPPRNAVRSNPADGTTIGSIVDSLESQQFEFTAANISGFISSGTAVYYRIYNNINDLQSHARQINDANTENTSNGFNRVESLGYLSMASSTDEQPFIKRYGGVIIRLASAGGYTAGISGSTAIPHRYDGKIFNFDLTTPPELADTLPKAGDQDYDDGTNDGEPYWYVNAYAVSTGLDAQLYTPVTSEVLSLGFIAYSQ